MYRAVGKDIRKNAMTSSVTQPDLDIPIIPFRPFSDMMVLPGMKKRGMPAEMAH
jgi:hypothetical protein